jgi:hypothetical protein
VPTVENVLNLLGYAMVMMIVGIIPMKETVQVKGLSSKSSGNLIVSPDFCFSS